MAEAPGVYIKESASLSLSVQSAATAVPVFIGYFKQKNPSASIDGDKCIALSSWLDFTHSFEPLTSIEIHLKDVTQQWRDEKEKELSKNSPPATQKAKARAAASSAESEASKELGAESEAPKKVETDLAIDGMTQVNGELAFILQGTVYAIKAESPPTITFDYSALALQHYFVNGGTHCYLLPLLNDADLPKLGQEIQKFPDISLLVCPEPVDHLQKILHINKADVYAQLNPLLDKNLGYFLIADSEDGKAKAATRNDQTAVYFPKLVTTFKLTRPADTQIALKLEAQDKSVEAQKFELETFSELKNRAEFEVFYQGAIEYIDQVLRATEIILPPSAAVAGAYATTDRARGVWKAPANVSLNAVDRVDKVVTDTEHGKMNSEGINVIRTFTGQGTLIWGARTCETKSDHWRYVPVRRLFNAVERDIGQAMRLAMFEANAQPTWEQVKAAIENYLYRLWQQGALLGNSAKEAYFIQVGKGLTMTQEDIEQGRMVVNVGMAAVRPAEFILLQFTQNMT